MTDIAQDKDEKQLLRERKEYLVREYGSLVGKTIRTIRPLSKQECDDLGWEFGWHRDAFAVIFTDGTAFIPMCDPEGNGPGFLAVADEVAK